MNRILKNLAIYMLIVLLAVSILRWTDSVPEQQEIFSSFSEFVTMVESGRIEHVNIVTQDNYQIFEGTTVEGESFAIETPKNYDRVLDLMLENGVTVDQYPTPQPSFMASLFTSLLPVVLILIVFFFFMQQSQGSGGKVMQFGKSRAKLNVDEKNPVTFKDVAGADEVKQELEEVIEFLKSPKKFLALGAKIPKGILLFGSPGTGKTLLAKAVAGEAEVPFFSISGSDFVEMFVGVGASRVRDLFEQAKKNSPCIIFIDEIDAVGRQRGAGLGGGHDEREQTLNQLLVEMDGFSTNEGIIIIAATNRPDILDKALLRPGRFDRQVTVGLPDVKGRKEILEVHVKGKPLADDVDLRIIAKGTIGFTGADLANLVNEGALLAARENRKKITQRDLGDAIERVLIGPERKSGNIHEMDRKLVAYHEAGHALVSRLLNKEGEFVQKVTIVPRGPAGGYTLHLPVEDRNFETKKKLLAGVAMILGGRVAEEVVLHDVSTGASNDLERATSTVRKMVMEWGMSDEIGPLTLGHPNTDTVFLGRDIARDRNYSEAIAFSIDKEVRRIIGDCYEDARRALTENIDVLHRVAQTLMVRETIDGKEFEALFTGEDPGETYVPGKKKDPFAENETVEAAGEENVSGEMPGEIPSEEFPEESSSEE